MPQVPYVPYPTAEPSDQGVPEIRLDTPGVAFGTTIAKAIEGFGATLEHSGDKIFQRAVDLQNLQNQNEATQLKANYILKAGDMQAEFLNREGANAGPAALKQHSAALEDLRKQTISQASNPAVRRLANSEMLGQLATHVFQAARYSGSQVKVATREAAKSGIEAYMIDAVQDPHDEERFQRNAQKVRVLEYEQAAAHGLGVDVAENNVNRDIELMKARRITELVKNGESFEAEKMYKEYKGQLGTHGPQVAAQVLQSQRTVSSRIIADTILAQIRRPFEEGEKQPSEQELLDQAMKMVDQQDSTDPVLKDYVRQQVMAGFRQEKQVRANALYDNQQILQSAMQSGNVTNITQLQAASPAAGAAFHALPPSEQNAWPGKINRFIAARDYQENQEELTRLRGLRETDPQEFLKVEPTQMKLNQAQMRTVMDWQKQARAHPEGNPNFNRAMATIKQSMGPTLEALKIFNRTEQNKDDYDYFRGNLSTQLEIFYKEHGRQPTNEELLTKIAPPLLRSQPGQWFWNLPPEERTWENFPSTKQKGPIFKEEPPSWFVFQLRQRAAARGEVEPTTEEEKMLWQRHRLLRYHEGKETIP